MERGKNSLKAPGMALSLEGAIAFQPLHLVAMVFSRMPAARSTRQQVRAIRRASSKTSDGCHFWNSAWRQRYGLRASDLREGV